MVSKPVDAQLMAFLTYIGDARGYRQVGDLFDMTRRTAHKTVWCSSCGIDVPFQHSFHSFWVQVRRVGSAILKHFSDEIRWPTKAESRRTEQAWFRKFASSLVCLSCRFHSEQNRTSRNSGCHGWNACADKNTVKRAFTSVFQQGWVSFNCSSRGLQRGVRK